jgi:hypothetical protein
MSAYQVLLANLILSDTNVDLFESLCIPICASRWTYTISVLKNIQIVPGRTADEGVYILSGQLPIESVLHYHILILDEATLLIIAFQFLYIFDRTKLSHTLADGMSDIRLYTEAIWYKSLDNVTTVFITKLKDILLKLDMYDYILGNRLLLQLIQDLTD